MAATVYTAPTRFVGCIRLISWCLRSEVQVQALQAAVPELLDILWKLDTTKVSARAIVLARVRACACAGVGARIDER